MSICATPHPHLAGVVCTKPEGHPGCHGKPPTVQRSVFWHLRPVRTN